MEREQFFKTIKSMRTYLSAHESTVSDNTARQYRQANTRMENSNQTPLQMGEGSKRSYYFYRAAKIHCALERIRNIIKFAIFAYEEGDQQAADKSLSRARIPLETLVRYRPDRKRQNKNSGEAGEWLAHRRKKLGETSEHQKGGEAKNRIRLPHAHTKMLTIKKLPAAWRQTLWSSIPPKSQYLLPIAVLSCSGCRPGELEYQKEIEPGVVERGVKVQRVDEGLQFTIKGLKTGNGNYGQPWRTITIAVDSVEAIFLAGEVDRANGVLWVASRARPLKDALSRVSKRVWRDETDHVSPYCYRHQFASDMKAQGFSIEVIAQALGHSVDDTQRLYGRAWYARGGGNKVQKVDASRQVRQTWRQPPRTGSRLGRKPGFAKPSR